MITRRIILFICSLLVLAASSFFLYKRIAGDPSRPPGRRTIVLPSQLTPVSAHVRDWGSTDEEAWKDLKPVKTRIDVPAGKELRLKIYSGAGARSTARPTPTFLRRILQKLGFKGSPKRRDGISFLDDIGWNDVQELFLPQDLSDAHLVHVGRLRGLRRIVFFPTSTVTGSGFGHLEKMKWLESLDLYSCENVADSAMQAIGRLPALRELTLSCTRLGDEGLAYLAESKSLEKLNLYFSCTTDAGLVYVGKMTALRELILMANNVSDAGMPHLAGLTLLKRLDLDKTRVTGAGLEHLAGLKSLERLELRQTRVGDEGVVHLSRLRSLRELNVYRTNVTEAAVARLRKALPECKISSGDRYGLGPLPVYRP